MTRPIIRSGTIVWRNDRPRTLNMPVDSVMSVQAAAAAQMVGAAATAANNAAPVVNVMPIARPRPVRRATLSASKVPTKPPAADAEVSQPKAIPLAPKVSVNNNTSIDDPAA